MGSFAYYTGCMTIPEEKKPVFVEQMCRLLYLGGMMTTEEVKMFGNTLTLLKPVPQGPKQEKRIFISSITILKMIRGNLRVST